MKPLCSTPRHLQFPKRKSSEDTVGEIDANEVVINNIPGKKVMRTVSFDCAVEFIPPPLEKPLSFDTEVNMISLAILDLGSQPQAPLAFSLSSVGEEQNTEEAYCEKPCKLSCTIM